jgi:hypothetical protein
MKRTLLALALGLSVAGVVLASAASIGGVGTDLLAADVTAVAACDTDGVDLSYTTAFDGTDNRYEVNAVTVTGIAAGCETGALAVTLSNTAGDQSVEGTGAVGATGTETVVVAGFPATVVEHASVVINGGAGS